MAARHLLDGCDPRSLIVSAVDFRHVDDSNVSRRSRVGWWEAWIGAVKRISFAIRKTVVETVERAYEWVRKQVAPTLAFLDQFFGKDALWMYRLCDANEHRISPERRALLDAQGCTCVVRGDCQQRVIKWQISRHNSAAL
jgi:hypothetical protein